MKKTFLRICLTAISSVLAWSAATAQALPNGTLETWEARGPYQAPTGWFTTDDIVQTVLPGFPFAVGNTTRTTDKHAGTYAAKLENKTSVFLGQPLLGILGIGGTVNPNATTLGGIAFTSRPARLEFYYKLTGPAAADDSAGVQVILTRTVNGQQTFVASGEMLIRPAAGYTQALVPIEYASSLAPDSIQLLFLSSTKQAPIDGTALFVDDIIMTGTVASVVDAARNAAVTVSPNPSATGLFMLTMSRDASWTRAAYTVSDLTGRVVLRQAAANITGPRPVDLRGQRAGVYTLRLETPEGPVVHKLLIP